MRRSYAVAVQLRCPGAVRISLYANTQASRFGAVFGLGNPSLESAILRSVRGAASSYAWLRMVARPLLNLDRELCSRRTMSTRGELNALGIAAALYLLVPALSEAQPTTTRVSVGPGGAQGDRDSGGSRPTQRGSAIGGDGRWVAFSVPRPATWWLMTNRWADVFLHDRQTGTTTRVSQGECGIQADGPSAEPVTSGDGYVIAYTFVGQQPDVRGPVRRHERRVGHLRPRSPGGSDLEGEQGIRRRATEWCQRVAGD